MNENRRLKGMTIRDFEEMLYKQNSEQPIGKRSLQEENTRLYLYYNSDGRHFGTYNRDKRTAHLIR